MPTKRYLLSRVAALLLALAAGVAAGAAAAAAAAEDYPARPIHLIIPFPPGGSNDVVGRMIAIQLSERLGKQIVVDNRSGAGGTIGTEAAANAVNDGYTLLVISIAHAVNPWLYKLNYDPIKSFVPVGILATGPNILVVNPQVPIQSVKELIAYAKQKPGDLHYASAGVGSFQHLGGELFKLTAGVDILHIPFRGGGPAMIDVMGGFAQVMFSSLVQTTPHIRSGALRALGTGGLKRSPVLPDVPTIDEAGLPGYEAVNWWGIMAPAGTPPEIVAKLNAALAEVQSSPETQQRFANEGAEVTRMAPAEFGAFVVKETAKWERVVKQSGIKAE